MNASLTLLVLLHNPLQIFMGCFRTYFLAGGLCSCSSTQATGMTGCNSCKDKRQLVVRRKWMSIFTLSLPGKMLVSRRRMREKGGKWNKESCVAHCFPSPGSWKKVHTESCFLWEICIFHWPSEKFYSHLLFNTCGIPLSPSLPLIPAVTLISIILVWHGTQQLASCWPESCNFTHTLTYLFFPECSFSLAIVQSCSTGANRTF